MPHIVILTPKGADVSAGKSALEKAGFEVEVVDAEAANLIHIASGMLENEQESSAGDDEVASTEDSVENELPEPAESAPDEKEKSKDKDSKEEKKQANESFLGMVNIDDESVPAYLGKSNILWASGVKKNNEMQNKVSFALNESIVSVWKDSETMKLKLTVNGKSVQAKLMEAKGKTKLVVDAKTSKQLKICK